MARETIFHKGTFAYRGGDNIQFNGDVTVVGTLTAPSLSLTGGDLTVSDDLAVGGDLAVTGAATFTLGAQSAAVARTATADGTGTGTIAPGTRFVAVTAGGDANAIIRLPAPVVGNVIEMWVGATGFELRSTVGSTINGVAGGDTNELAIPATTYVFAICVAADTWIVDALDEAGADIAALVPDAV